MADNQTPAPKPVEAVRVSPASTRNAPAAAQAAPPAPKVEAKPEAQKPTPEQQLESRAKELDKLHAKLAEDRRKFAEERKGAKSKDEEYESWKRLREERRRNPAKYLEQDFGPDWYDALTKLKLDGGPPSGLIAAEVDEKTSSLQKQLEEKTAALEKRLEEMQRAEAQREKNRYLDGAAEYAKANASKFPLVNHFGEFGSVKAEIEAHFKSTTTQDDEGHWVPGETLTPEDAAARVEEKLKKVADTFRAYFAEEEKKKGTTPQGRRSDTTPRREEAPTQDEGWTPPKDERERWARAMAAGDRAMASRQH